MLSQTKRRLPSFFSAWSWGRRARPRTAEMRTVIAELGDLNRTSERGFLLVGGKLADFMTALQRVRDGTATVADLLSSQRADEATAALQGVLAQSEGMESRLQSHSGLLHSVTAAARELSLPVISFATAVRTFRVLGTMIRIESSRLSQAESDLETLAADVHALTVELGRRTDQMLEGCEALRERAETSLAHTRRATSQQKQRLPELVEAVMEGVSAVQQRRSMAQQTALEIVKQYERALALVSEIVSDMQSHDITRQRVEHVMAALEGALEAPRATLAPVLSLQGRQLRESGDLFARSVSGMCGNLTQLAREVRNMSEQTHSLLQNSGSDGGDFLAELESTYAEVLAGLADCRRLDRDLPDAGAALAATARQVAGLAGEIEEVGWRMHLIALNTSIRAAHIGLRGEPLGRLGNATQMLCSVAQEGAGRVTAVLQSMEAERQAKAAEQGVDEAIPEEALRGRIVRLRASRDAARKQAEHMADVARDLAAVAESLVEELERRSAFSRVVAGCAEKLERLAGECGASAGGGAGEPQLDRLMALYTMDSERAAHNGDSGEASTAVESPDDKSEDNVEFF